jgi:hypothetical protein
MEYTSNLNLKLPSGTDKVRVSDLNSNFESLDGYVNGARQRLDIVEELADELRDDVNELLNGGGTGGGVTPASYIIKRSTKSINDTLWQIETWSDGFVRCWCEYKHSTDINFNLSMATGRYYANFVVFLPSVFSDYPLFISITPRTSFPVSCGVDQSSYNKDEFTLTLVNNYDGADKMSMIEKDMISFFIEVRGDGSVG